MGQEQGQTQTHHLTFGDGEVRKRYVTWDRGEADREWACLTLLAQHAPGVAPRPLRRELEDGAPVIVMERLPGTPLDGTPLTPAQTTSLGAALRRMYDVPVAAIHAAGVTERAYGPTALAGEMTDWLSDDYDLDECLEPVLVRDAVAAALQWLADLRRPGPGRCGRPHRRPATPDVGVPTAVGVLLAGDAVAWERWVPSQPARDDREPGAAPAGVDRGLRRAQPLS